MEIPAILGNLADWDTATPTERRGAAEAIAAQLPPTWKLTGLETFALGDQLHEIASFEYEGATFRLIPGSLDAVLGYDTDNPWVPAKELEADLEKMRQNWFPWDAYEDNLSPIRTVGIAPCLVESASTKATWLDELEEDSAEEITLSSVAESYRQHGFRLPTSDEWEYLCRAGTRAFWRWGNTIPVEENHRPTTDIHFLPNAFGLTFHASTYDSELCDDGELVASDGGSSVCGGYGIVASWIPLACAFRESRDEVEDLIMEYGDGMHIRRLLPLIK